MFQFVFSDPVNPSIGLPTEITTFIYKYQRCNSSQIFQITPIKYIFKFSYDLRICVVYNEVGGWHELKTTREKADYFYRYIKHSQKKKNRLPNFIKEKAMMVNLQNIVNFLGFFPRKHDISTHTPELTWFPIVLGR